MPEFRHYDAGDPPTFSAAEVNAWSAAAKAEIARRGGAQPPRPLASPAFPANTVLVKNDTGSDLPEFSVLSVADTPAVSPTDFPLDVQRRPYLVGTRPLSRDDPFVVTREPIPAGAFGLASLDGLAVCDVQLGSPAQFRAGPLPGVTSALGGSCDGPAKILNRESWSPGTVRCLVQLGPGAAAPAWCGNYYSTAASSQGLFQGPGAFGDEDVPDFYGEDNASALVTSSVTAFDPADCVRWPFVVHAGLQAYVEPSDLSLDYWPISFGVYATLAAFDADGVYQGTVAGLYHGGGGGQGSILPVVRGQRSRAGDFTGDWVPPGNVTYPLGRFVGSALFGGDVYHGQVNTVVRVDVATHRRLLTARYLAWVVGWSVSVGQGGATQPPPGGWLGKLKVVGLFAGGTYILTQRASFDGCDPPVPDPSVIVRGRNHAADEITVPGPEIVVKPTAAPTADPASKTVAAGASLDLAANPIGGASEAPSYSGFTWYANGNWLADGENPTVAMPDDAGDYLIEVYFQDDQGVQGRGVYGTVTVADSAAAGDSPLVAFCTTQLDKTNATLTDVPGMELTLPAGWYEIGGMLNVDLNSPGGGKVTLAGTVTPILINWCIQQIDGAASRGLSAFEPTALGDPLSFTTALASPPHKLIIRGYIRVDIPGTLKVQFAQDTTDAVACSVLVGSVFRCTPANP